MIEGLSGTTTWLIMAALVLLMFGPAVLAEIRDRMMDDRPISEEAMKDIDRRKNRSEDYTP